MLRLEGPRLAEVADQYQCRFGFTRWPAASLRRSAEAARLVASHLWAEVDGGYQFHEFLQRNPTREQVESERAASAERQRRARDAARAKREEERSNVTHLSRR